MDRNVLKVLGIVGGVGFVFWLLNKDNKANAATRGYAIPPAPPSPYTQPPKVVGGTASVGTKPKSEAEILASQDYGKVKPPPVCQAGLMPISSDFGVTWSCIKPKTTTGGTSQMCPAGYNAIPNLETGQGFVCLPA